MLEASPVPAYRRVEAQVADVAGDELLLLERGGHAEGVADHRLLHRVHLEGEGGTGWLGGTGTRSTHPAVLSVGSQLPGTILGSHRALRDLSLCTLLYIKPLRGVLSINSFLFFKPAFKNQRISAVVWQRGTAPVLTISLLWAAMGTWRGGGMAPARALL